MKTLDLAKPALLHERPRPWRDNLDAWFDRLLTSPAVYRWTVSNPLTRWITRRRAQQVFDLMAGFVHTQVLLACVRLRILELVCESPRTLEELAAKCQVPASALQRLLESARALRLLELRGQGRYGLGSLGAPVAGHAGLRAMIEHHAVLYQDLQDPVALLLDQLPQGQMAKYWPYAETGPGTTGERRWQPDQVSRYSNLMSASQPFVVDEVIATYAFTDHRCVLDVGGGQGTLSANSRGTPRTCNSSCLIYRRSRHWRRPTSCSRAWPSGPVRLAATFCAIPCPRALTWSPWCGWHTITLTSI